MTPISEMSKLPSAPRDVQLSFAGKDRLAFPIVFLILAAGALIYLVTSRHAHMDALYKDGNAINAFVYGKHSDSGKSTTYYLDFSYPANGETYTGADEVSYDIYDSAVPNSTRVPVTYLPSNPDEYEIGRVDQGRVTDDLNDTLLGSGALIAIPILWVIAVILATKRDLAFGRVCLEVDGRVSQLYTKVVQGRYGPTTYYWMKYDFTTGSEHFSRDVKVDRYYLSSHSEGGAIPVFYDPVNPSASRIQREMTMVSCAILP